MKKVDIWKLNELSTKYANQGLTIDFLFDFNGLTLIGRLDPHSCYIAFYQFTRKYSYKMLKLFPKDTDIESLVDEFKEEMFTNLNDLIKRREFETQESEDKE